jgi:hypothetical protein
MSTTAKKPDSTPIVRGDKKLTPNGQVENVG